MTRNHRAQLASETLSVLAEGRYRNATGASVDLQPSLERCLKGTELWLPEALRKLRDTLATQAPPFASTELEVVNETTLEGGWALVASGRFEHVAVLNFASAKNPGGGFLGGSQAQEESLARSSALYASLRRKPEFYDYHREHPSLLYSDRMIWSPRCPVFRDDEGNLLVQPWEVSCVTSPAPNAGAIASNAPGDSPRIPGVLATRAELVLALAAHHGVDALVLGAWGCGVFRNDPAMVAGVFARLLRPGSPWFGRFSAVRFSVFDAARPAATCETFRREIFNG